MKRFLRQPLVHFFILGALLFGVDHVRRGDPTKVAITSGVRAEVARRFQDESGRAPSAAELEKALRSWKQDEALFREALRLGLDRNDRTIRTALIEKLRTQAMLEAPRYEPSDAELDQWLTAHRDQYEVPRRFALEWLTFDAGAQGEQEQRRVSAELLAAVSPQQLRRPVFGARLTELELRERWGDTAASAVVGAPLGAWREVRAPNQLLLVRVNEVDGGLPPAAELRARLRIDYVTEKQRQAAARALEAVVGRYHFVEQN